jgi:DNA-binding NarL/FixJ family response regulator
MMGREAKSIKVNIKRILIVEDNVFFLQFLRRILSARFPWADILEATNGEEALKKIKMLPPDAIFMDLRLPGENGLEVTRKIKAQYPNIVIVIITNYDLPEYREAAYHSKADHFLSKDLFLNMLNSILPNRNMEQDDSNPKEPS